MLHHRLAWAFVLSRKSKTQAFPSHARIKRKSSLQTRSAIASASGCKSCSGVVHRRAVSRRSGCSPSALGPTAAPPAATCQYRSLAPADHSAGPALPQPLRRFSALRVVRRTLAAIRAASWPARRPHRAPDGRRGPRNREASDALIAPASASQSTSSTPLPSHSVQTPSGVDRLLTKSSARWSPVKKAGGRVSEAKFPPIDCRIIGQQDTP